MTDERLTLDLEAFQGPFDLLLHLIREMKVDINDIPMQAITSQYLAYVESMQAQSLDLAADYLVMAATLIEIKSRLLLPIEPDLTLEDEEEMGDPRELLVQQLLLYQQFQTVATVLEQKQADRSQQFTRPAVDLSPLQSFVPLAEDEVSLSDLTQAMQVALMKELENQPMERTIESQVLSVQDQVDKIMTRLTQRSESMELSDFIELGTVDEWITTFMAMLELVRNHQIEFEQIELMGPIEMTLKVGD